ncbi:MAG: hypothetical protein ABGY75_06300 [Gemmataceae bacterium]
MADEGGFLKAILAHPADDLTRLVVRCRQQPTPEQVVAFLRFCENQR